jgi:hypothetical protein
MNPVAPAFFLYLVVMGWLFQRRTQWLTRFGIFTTLLGGLFVRYGVAVPFSDNVNPAITRIAIKPERLADYYVAVVVSYAGIYLGVWLLDLAWRARTLDRARAKLGEVRTVSPTWALALVAGLITAVVLVAWVIIPWTDFVNGIYSFVPGHTSAAYRQHRIQYGNDTTYLNSGYAYLGSFARFALAPVALWILFFHRNRSRLLHVMFWVLLAALLVIGFLSGQKLPEILLVGGLVVALLIQRGRPSLLEWRLGGIVVASVAGFILVIGPALYHLQYPQLDYATVLQLTVYRLTEEYSRVAQLRFVFYPDLHPYLNGMSSFILRGLAHLMGINTSSAQSPEIYIPSHSPGVGPSYGGAWNAGFFADAWADFGFVGVAGASVFVGSVVRAIDRWYTDSGQRALEMGVYAAVCISALYVSEVATLTSLWTYGLGSAFLVYAVLRLCTLGWSPLQKKLALGRPAEERAG